MTDKKDKGSLWEDFKKNYEIEKEKEKNRPLAQKKNVDAYMSTPIMAAIYMLFLLIPADMVEQRLGISGGVIYSVVVIVSIGLAIFTVKKITNKTYGDK